MSTDVAAKALQWVTLLMCFAWIPTITFVSAADLSFPNISKHPPQMRYAPRCVFVNLPDGEVAVPPSQQVGRPGLASARSEYHKGTLKKKNMTAGPAAPAEGTSV